MAHSMADNDTSDIPTRGCVVITGVIVALLGVSFAVLIILGRGASERQRAARVESQFNDAQGRSVAHVLMDPEVINKLADDEESAEALVDLSLSSINFRDADVASVRKLAKVKKVYIYSCSHAEDFLRALQGSHAIEELSFDTTVLNDDGFQLLATYPNLRKVRFTYIADKNRVDQLRATIPNVVVEVDETD